MEKITLNGIRYIALGDFNHLRRNLVKDIYDRYEKDEAGQIHLSELDQGRVDALTSIMSEIMERELYMAESADEIREMHKEIEREWMRSNFVIVGKDAETGEKIYFRKRCEHVEEGKNTPVFTSMKRLAKTWHDHHSATLQRDFLQHETGFEDLRVVPIFQEYASAKDLLKAIFGDDDDASGVGQTFSPDADDEKWCIQCAPIEDGEDTMWFTNWIVYTDDMPEHMKATCERSGMKPGDTQPMFVADKRMVQGFVDKATAEGVLLKIAQLQPDMTDYLSVVTVEDEDDD